MISKREVDELVYPSRRRFDVRLKDAVMSERCSEEKRVSPLTMYEHCKDVLSSCGL